MDGTVICLEKKALWKTKLQVTEICTMRLAHQVRGRQCGGKTKRECEQERRGT